MTLLTSQLAPMHFSKTQTTGKGVDLEHERSKGGGTDKAETSLDGASGTSRLGESGGAGAVTRAGGRGAEGVGDGHGAGGLDGGVVAGSTGGSNNGLDSGGVGSNGGVLDDSRRRSDGVGGSRAGLDGVTGGRGRRNGVAGSGGAGDSGGGAGNRGGGAAGGDSDGAVGLGDTELGGVLVLAVAFDQLETVVGNVSLEGGGRSPGEGTRVVDVLGESLDGDDIGGGATEQEERDLVGGGWLPSDGEGLASRDNLGFKSVRRSPASQARSRCLPRSRDG
jgi:hypothetical protein